MSIRKGTITISGKGADGYSPTAFVSKSGNISTLRVTDANGTTSVSINDGENYSYNINTISGTSITLNADTVNKLNITADTTFTLPTITDGKFHQILVIANVTGTPTITWGTSYYFSKIEPILEEGYNNIIYEYDGTNWYVGAIIKGTN